MFLWESSMLLCLPKLYGDGSFFLKHFALISILLDFVYYLFTKEGEGGK